MPGGQVIVAGRTLPHAVGWRVEYMCLIFHGRV